MDISHKNLKILFLFLQNKNRISAQPYYLENLGIQYIASYLRKHNYDVYLINADGFELNNDQVLDRILGIKPDFIGMSPCYTNMSTAVLLANTIKKKLPDTIICFGGQHSTFFVDEILHHEVSIDYIILGEGEISIHLLLK